MAERSLCRRRLEDVQGEGGGGVSGKARPEEGNSHGRSVCAFACRLVLVAHRP